MSGGCNSDARKANKNQIARLAVSLLGLIVQCIKRVKGFRTIKLKREVSRNDRSSDPHFSTCSSHHSSRTLMSSITGYPKAPSFTTEGLSLKASDMSDATAPKPASDLDGARPSVSFAKRLYDAWKAGFGPSYGIDTKRGDEFMQMFDAHPHNIKCLRKDAVAGEDEEDRRERNRQRDRLRSAYLKTSPSGKAYWSTEQHEEFEGYVVGSE